MCTGVYWLCCVQVCIDCVVYRCVLTVLCTGVYWLCCVQVCIDCAVYRCVLTVLCTGVYWLCCVQVCIDCVVYRCVLLNTGVYWLCCVQVCIDCVVYRCVLTVLCTGVCWLCCVQVCMECGTSTCSVCSFSTLLRPSTWRSLTLVMLSCCDVTDMSFDCENFLSKTLAETLSRTWSLRPSFWPHGKDLASRSKICYEGQGQGLDRKVQLR